MFRTCVAVLLTAAVGVAAPVPKALKKQPSLDGRWEAVLMHASQRDIIQGNTTVWDISGDKLTRSFKQPDGTLRSNLTLTITFPDSSKPDELDYGTGPNETLFRARILLTAEELTIRFADANAPRPADMTEGNDGYYYQFKRIEK